MRRPASAEDAELTTIPAPRPERRRAIAAPMPLDEPVTMTALPARSIPFPSASPAVPGRKPSPGPGCPGAVSSRVELAGARRPLLGYSQRRRSLHHLPGAQDERDDGRDGGQAAYRGRQDDPRTKVTAPSVTKMMPAARRPRPG